MNKYLILVIALITALTLFLYSIYFFQVQLLKIEKEFKPPNTIEENIIPIEIEEEPEKSTLARITCYNWTGNKMANNKYPEYGYVATSDRSIPFGTEIIIDGETFIVGDRTALWVDEKFGLTIDIYLDNCDMTFGAKRKEIIIINN
jgi:3D (Asp-Asp-Asp) domain-containing protein